jgi:putative tricarboxylic transport membrane protein
LVQVLRVRGRVLLPIIAGFCVIGAYALRNNPVDIAIMLVLGVIGYFLKKGDFPTIPLILAVVLGPSMEEHLRMALTLSEGSPLIFLTHPISCVFIILAVISFLVPIIKGRASA